MNSVSIRLAFIHSLVAPALVLLFLSNISIWYDTYQKDVITGPSFLAAALAGGLGYLLLDCSRGFNFLKRNRYAYWCLAVLVIYALNWARLSATGAPGDHLKIATDAIQYFLLAPAFAVMLYYIPFSYLKLSLALLVLLAPIVLIFDFVSPETLHPYGIATNIETGARVSGFWLNPNAAAEAVILILILAGSFLKKNILALAYTLASIAVLLTASRAGMIGIVVVGLMLLASGKLSRWIMLLPILTVAFYSNILTFYENTAETVGREQGVDEVLSRIDFVTGKGEGDGSSEDRLQIAKNAFTLSLDQPVLGHGIRYIDPESDVGPHNMLIDWFYQYGIFGVMLWLALLLLLYGTFDGPVYRNLGLFAFAWFTAFTHNMFESNVWFVFIGIMLIQRPYNATSALVSAPMRGKKRRRRRRSSSEQTSAERGADGDTVKLVRTRKRRRRK